MEWGGRMGTMTQGGISVVSIEARGWDEQIGSLGERRVQSKRGEASAHPDVLIISLSFFITYN